MKAVLVLLLGVSVSPFCAANITFNGTVAISGNLQLSGNALTVPSKATGFSPADGAVHVVNNPTLVWENGGGALTYTVIGDTFTPPTTVRSSSQAGLTYAATVGYATTFYWKINPINNSGTTTGDILSFTTETRFVADGYSSLNVGGSDGDALTVAKLNTGTEVSLGTWSISATVATNIKSGVTYKIATLGTTSGATWISLGDAVVTPAIGDVFVSVRNGTGADGTGTATVPLAYIGVNATNLYSPIIANSTTYQNGATTSVKYRMDSQVNCSQLTMTTPVAKMSFGFWLTLGQIAGSNAEIIDIFNATTALGGFSVIQMSNTGLLHIHTETNGGSQTGPNITGTTLGTTYWATVYSDQHGQGGATDVLKLYDTGGALVGTSSVDTSGSTDKASNYTIVYIGRSDSHAGNNEAPSTSYLNYSNLVINTSTLAYPLGP